MTGIRIVLSLAAAVMLAALFILKADATPLTSAVESPALAGSHSTVQPVGCIFGTRRCPAGTKWSCVHTPGAKKCVCRAC